jgi:hypothetical protein
MLSQLMLDWRMAPLCCLVVFLLTGPLVASDVAPPSVEELTLRSDAIFSGTCLAWSSRWDERSGIIVTDATFRVDRYIKGAGPTEVQVTSPGGILPERNLEMTVTGMAEYTRGEEALIFVTRAANGELGVYGMGRGKLPIQRDAARVRRVRGESLDALIRRIESIVQSRSGR